MTRIGAAVDGLVQALSVDQVCRFGARLNPAGGLTVTVGPPDAPDLGYLDAPCPPGPATLECVVLIAAATADVRGARALLDRLDTIAATCDAAGWAPVSATAESLDDRPAYALLVRRTGVKP